MTDLPSEIAEVVETIQRLQHEFEDLAVGGLRPLGPERLPLLHAMRDECQRIGADHLAQRIGTLADAIRQDERDAATALLRAQSSLRVFERMLTLDVAATQLMALQPDEDDDPTT